MVALKGHREEGLSHGRAGLLLATPGAGGHCLCERRCGPPFVSDRHSLPGTRVTHAGELVSSQEERRRRLPTPSLTDLLVVNTIIVIVAVAGVPNAILVKVFLPRIRQEGAVVLYSEEAHQS